MASVEHLEFDRFSFDKLISRKRRFLKFAKSNSSLSLRTKSKRERLCRESFRGKSKFTILLFAWFRPIKVQLSRCKSLKFGNEFGILSRHLQHNLHPFSKRFFRFGREIFCAPKMEQNSMQFSLFVCFRLTYIFLSKWRVLRVLKQLFCVYPNM